MTQDEFHPSNGINNDSVRVLERQTIYDFVAGCSEQLTGLVLDYGCGTMPYRDLVDEAGGTYRGYDRPHYPGAVMSGPIGSTPFQVDNQWDAILCTQVVQYIPRPLDLLRQFRFALRAGGHMILTGPTNWAEVEPGDLSRFTLAGARHFVSEAGFVIERADRRAGVNVNGFELSLGYGILARKP